MWAACFASPIKKKKKKTLGRERLELSTSGSLNSYETYALANCATAPLVESPHLILSKVVLEHAMHLLIITRLGRIYLKPFQVDHHQELSITRNFEFRSKWNTQIQKNDDNTSTKPQWVDPFSGVRSRSPGFENNFSRQKPHSVIRQFLCVCITSGLLIEYLFGCWGFFCCLIFLFIMRFLATISALKQLPVLCNSKDKLKLLSLLIL